MAHNQIFPPKKGEALGSLVRFQRPILQKIRLLGDLQMTLMLSSSLLPAAWGSAMTLLMVLGLHSSGRNTHTHRGSEALAKKVNIR